MCGIVGIAGLHEVKWLEQMNGMIVHRGPDDQGVYTSPDRAVSLAMRRLSILDLEGGHQPMSNDDGSVWIVFNGEIYNAPDLRRQLEAKGRGFKTAHSDTEVLLRLYEDRGESMVEDLNGMFAFVIYDRRQNRLFGARDRLGIKPLYYALKGGVFAFASEMKSLLALPMLSARHVNRQALRHYVSLLYVPGPHAIVEGAIRVPPAHRFVYDLTRRSLTLTQYWKIESTEPEHRSLQEWTQILRQELRNAVSRWTLSDVPIACSLSGGIDSSAVVGVLAERGYSRLRTYSLGFEGEEEQPWNELHLARRVAERWGTVHHEIVLKPDHLLNDLIEMVWYLDEPYGGGLPSWYVFREMSKDVKVGLTGTGGDELFGNYQKFTRFEEDPVVRAAVRFRQRFPSGASTLASCTAPLAAVSGGVPSSWPVFGRGRIVSKLPNLFRMPFGAYYRSNLDIVAEETEYSLTLEEHHGHCYQKTGEYIQNLFDQTGATDLRTGLAMVDIKTQLAEEFLFMTDRFSMAHSLEARTPLLDHHFVELVFRIPGSVRTKPGDPKYLLKKTVEDLLPPELLTAPKRGFTIPIGMWLRKQLRPLAERLLSPKRLEKQALYRKEFHDRYVSPHLEGRADHALRVWSALMFQIWHLIYVEEACTSKPTFTWTDLC
ncbi:MAG TPA: asparagine synthase (glutamine-hydrolyzing) [Nitrospira sp.]|nr:asparagine synthase (glutamine-hydrolyzing) [Nitrospira sp.]